MRGTGFGGVKYKLIDFWQHSDKDANYSVGKALDVICEFVDGAHALHQSTHQLARETYSLRRRVRMMGKQDETLRCDKKR